MQKVILKVILAVCIVAAAVFATLLIRELYIDWQSRSFYDNLVAGVPTRPREPGRSGAENAQMPSQDSDDDDSIPWVPYVDFDALNMDFPGIVGWIILDGTFIDYPVMQYTDNDFFLTHLPDRTQHRSGSIFLDYRNKPDFSDKSILIYGHETRAGDMFGVLKEYRDQEFFEANSVMYLHTPEKDYMLVLFAGHVAHSVRDHPPLDFADGDEFLEYIAHLKSISVFKSSVEVSADDTIISLVTCTYDFSNARLILAGKLVEYYSE